MENNQARIQGLQNDIEELEAAISEFNSILAQPSLHRPGYVQEAETELPKYQTRLATKTAELRKLQGC